MKVEYKISVAGKDVLPVATCEVPDLKFEVKETPNSIEKTCTMHEIDAVEETLADLVNNFVCIKWKLPEEDDIFYREAEFPTWLCVGELCDRIEQLEKENAELKKRLT